MFSLPLIFLIFGTPVACLSPTSRCLTVYRRGHCYPGLRPIRYLVVFFERRDLKKTLYEAEGAKEYREANRRIQKAVKKAQEDWIGAQCEEIETCLNKNNSKRAYQLVKDLTSEKQGRSSTIQDKSGKCLTEEKEILSRWTEYCSELYNYESCGDNTVLDCSQPPEEDLQPIFREEVEIAIASRKRGSLPELIIYQQNLFKLAGRP